MVAGDVVRGSTRVRGLLVAGLLAGSAGGMLGVVAPASAAGVGSGPAVASVAAVHPGSASATSRPAPGTAFTAYASSWRAVVSKGVLRFEGTRLPTRAVRVQRSAFAKGVEFTGSSRGKPVELVVRSGRCIDVSGKNTGMTASLRYGRHLMRGCAVVGAFPIANT